MSLIEIKSEVIGTVWKLETEVGKRVEEDDELMIIESMKMEIPILSTGSGVIKEVVVKEGDAISQEDVLIILEE